MLNLDFFSNITIKRKLMLFAAFYVVLVFLFLATVTVAWNNIADSYRKKETIYQVVRFAQNARIAEKSYLRYRQKRHEAELVDACVSILSAIDKLKNSSAESKTVSDIRLGIKTYRQLFNNLVVVHGKMTLLHEKMTGVLDQTENINLAIGKLKTAVPPLSNLAKKVREYILELNVVFQQFLIVGELRILDKLSNIATNVGAELLNSSTLRSNIISDANIFPFAKQLQIIIEWSRAISNEAKELHLEETDTVDKMDKLGSKISLNADVLLAESEASNSEIKKTAIWLVLFLSIAGSILAVVVGILFNQIISSALTKVLIATHSLADGDLTTRIEVSGRDEIGQMASGFNKFIERLHNIIKEVDANTDILSSASADLTDTSNNLTMSVDKMNSRASKVSRAGNELSSDVDFMAASADEISSAANNVSSSIHEMSESIKEVSEKCAKESEIAKKANQKAQETNLLMQNLNGAAEKIGTIVQFINQIADQTNLLALNAHIEASSSGEAGKGFSVVANEIKELAQRSSHATDEITQQVCSIQKNITISVKEINEVNNIIEEVSNIAASIARVVEAQSLSTTSIAHAVKNTSSSTNELAQKIQRAAKGAMDVSQNIREINEETAMASKSATETFNSSGSLAEMALRLKKSIRQFKI